MSSSFFYSEELRTKLINYALRKAETQEYISLGALLDFARRIMDVRLSANKVRNLKRWIDRTLRNSGYFYTLKMEGLIWYMTAPAGRRAYFDLIKGPKAPKQNSNSSENSGFQTYRNKAEKVLQDYLYLNEDKYDYLEDLFTEYLELAANKVIVLQHRQQKDMFAVLGYKTRFTDEKRRRRLLAQYDHAWRYATEHYRDGVFLTLTTDPKRFNSIYEATMAISWAWNSFMAWLTKKLGRRAPYIKVLEFTKKGHPHLHVIFFDVSRIAEKEEITQEWNRLGQGIINYVYSIVNKNKRWVWKKRKPRNSGRSVMKYLKKYLLKTMSEKSLGTLALYWATNRRFYTTSRVLTKKTLLKSSGEWEFFGSCWYLTMNEYIPYWASIAFSEFWGDNG